jgi:HK97 family phage major capsid protein
VLSRLDAMQEEARAKFDIPAAPTEDRADKATLGDWSSIVFRMLTGEKISQKEIEYRIAAELITTDNLGVVPEQFLDEIIGIIDPSRPFLDSTRRLQTPAAGMTFNVPVIETRPTVGIQAAEKDELTSTATSITDTSFTPLTIGGYGDISIQLLKRSDPSYLSLYLELLSESYGIMADDKAVDALLAASGLNNGGNLDPEALSIGSAWANAMAVSRRLTPDTIWLSSDAVARFINAKADGTNQQLYGNLGGSFSAAGGTGGTISGLRPVHVPALDDEAADVIVGPSRGFAWAEDGTYTLQVDVPALAGREVCMIWFMPLYPAAFTRYALTAT